jgi:hypothetical protein
MSAIAKELDDYLHSLDPLAARKVEEAVRDLISHAAAEKKPLEAESKRGMLALADFAESMGGMTNAEIDRAIYGE